MNCDWLMKVCLPMLFILCLIDSYVNKGPNVTTENIFTSHELAEKLLVKSTSLVGTMNGKRKEVPTMSKICGSRL